MDSKKVKKCRLEWEGLRARGGVSARELSALAEKLGLEIVHSGTHVNWGSQDLIFRGLSVFQITSHRGDVNKITKNRILNSMEGYLIRLEKEHEKGEETNEEEFDD